MTGHTPRATGHGVRAPLVARLVCPLVILLAIAFSSPASADEPPTGAYTLTGLGAYADYVNRSSTGAFVNDSGDVLVYSSAPPPARQFLWSGSSVTEFAPLQAAGLNDADQVVGAAPRSTDEWHAFMWEHGMLVDLATLPGGASGAALGRFASTAVAISAMGHVVGGSATGPLQTLAMRGRTRSSWPTGR